MARPSEDLTVTMEDSDSLLAPVELHERSWLSQSVLRLRFVTQEPFPYQPGQYVSLVGKSGLTRCYSVASVPTLEPYLELHVRILTEGRMSQWLRDLPIGTAAQIRGPAGECFYVPGRPTQPLLMCGVGTGLAPLFGVVREALRQEHSGPIVLIHGARSPSGLYLRDELRELTAKHPNLSYLPVVLGADPSNTTEADLSDCIVSPLDVLVKSRFPKLTGQRAFLCGDAELVGVLRKQVFMQGCSRRDILADAFVMADRPTGS
jgi:NAD(P)H-flavin reductase